jgi:hypothetical protein
MARENEEQSLRDYGNRKKRYKQTRRLIIITLLLAFAAAGVFYLVSLYNRDYENYEVLKTTDVTDENSIGYLSYEGAVVKYSKDGAVAIDNNGKLLWNGSYQMTDPIVDTCGKYVVVADRGGKSIHIFNGKGSAGMISTLYDIIKVEIASKGVVAVLTEDDERNHIYLYDVKGTELVDKKTTVSNEGYPIDISLSDDGEKLITSYMSVTEGELISTIAFFNYGEVGQSHTDGFVGGKEFADIIVPRVTFLNNDTACIFKEKGFVLYSIEEIPSIIMEQDLEGEIQSVLYNEDFAGFVLQKENSSRLLVLYDLKGKKVLEKALDFDYDKIFLTQEEIVMHNNLSCLVMKLNGKVKFKHTFDTNISAFYPVNNLDRYLLVEENRVSEILLKE